ncbi:hypothetical protein M408DRAFT_159438 [Serendipita vermifera MAFF 305830]|uniref:Uncharacterized protein n=1 Tax=Serendipita vermifera MAFF 305830 TaxID=933852 RepID=A0A0C3B8K5_SERVB|nr:hypothetical protein M408DRAFT_159438 [Serendipita vermifera MAFF 305830]
MSRLIDGNPILDVSNAPKVWVAAGGCGEDKDTKFVKQNERHKGVNKKTRGTSPFRILWAWHSKGCSQSWGVEGLPFVRYHHTFIWQNKTQIK